MISPLKQMILDYEAGTFPFLRIAEYAEQTYNYELSKQELDSFRNHMILEDFLRQIMQHRARTVQS